jgi:lipopolysaccharide export system protein LptA
MRKTLLFLFVILIPALPLIGQESTGEDRYVRLIKANTAEMYQNESRNVRRITGPAQFLHNNTLLICDTAIWNVSLNTVDAIGNVKIIQNNTSLSGDRIHYIADSSLAKVRGHIVELMDRDSNRLRTFYLDFNTKDSIAWFYEGGAMVDKKGNIIESIRGTYDSKIEKFKFQEKVEMMSDSLVLRSDSLAYYANENRAEFLGQTYIWQSNSYLKAGYGWYERDKERYNFEKSVYMLDPKTEVWADRIYYNAPSGEAELFRDIQILDTVQSVIMFSDYAKYNREPVSARLYNNPSIAVYSVENNKPDTLFLAADTMLYNSVPKFLADSATVAQALKRYEQSKIDPFAVVTGKNQNVPGQQSEITANSPNSSPKKINPNQGESTLAGGLNAVTAGINIDVTLKDSLQKLPPDTAKIQSDTLAKTLTAPAKLNDTQTVSASVTQDTINKAQTISVAVAQDSLAKAQTINANVVKDSLAKVQTISANVAQDSLARTTAGSSASTPDSLKINTPQSLTKDSVAPVDSTLIRFIEANKNVRFYRSNLQGKCDSLIFNSVDSLIRLFKDPVMWNDKNQFTSDSIQLVTDNKKLRKVEFLSNAFAMAKEDTLHYNQIKATDLIAHFTDGELSRFDAFGGVNMLIFLAEDSLLTTMNHKECKTMTSKIANQTLVRDKCIDNAKSVIYPLFDLEPAKKRLRGFNIRESERPADRFAVCNREIKRSEREVALKVELPSFTQTNRFFRIAPEIPEVIIKTREPKVPDPAKLDAEGTAETTEQSTDKTTTEGTLQ